MPFEDQLKKVLELEREGEKRLDQARAGAAKLLEDARHETRRISQEGEATIARERRERTVAFDEETQRIVAEIRRQGRLEKERLRPLAEKNREAAAEAILSWLWGEE